MRSRFALGLALLLVGSWLVLGADDKVVPAKAPLPTGLVAPEAKVTNAAVVAFLEGPAVDAENNIYFSDIVGKPISTQSGRVIDHHHSVSMATRGAVKKWPSRGVMSLISCPLVHGRTAVFHPCRSATAPSGDTAPMPQPFSAPAASAATATLPHTDADPDAAQGRLQEAVARLLLKARRRERELAAMFRSWPAWLTGPLPPTN